jgi:RNAse (barnase) inhibitor barstar
LETLLRIRTWKVSLAIFCISYFVYSLLYSKNETQDLAMQIGYNLPMALVFTAIYNWLILRGSNLRVGKIVFAMFFITGIAGDTAHYQFAKYQVNNWITKSKLAINDDGSIVANGAVSKVPDNGLGVSKNLNIITDIVNENRAKTDKIDKFYQNEMLKIGFYKWLDLEQLSSDPDNFFLDRKALFPEAKNLIQQTREALDEVKATTLSELESKAKQDDFYRKFANNFQIGIQKTKRLDEEIWDAETSVVEIAENLILLLSENRGKWLVDQDQILFTDQIMLDKFNAGMSEIRTLVIKQRGLQEQLVEYTNSTLESARP